MRIIRVGSRESRLAVAQAQEVIRDLRRLCPETVFELVTMKTEGDRLQNARLDALGGKGLFLRELEAALESGRVDICVHSYKDMPVPVRSDLPVVAVSRRADPRDALVLPGGKPESGEGLLVGTASLRRAAQLPGLLPGCICAPVRGNIQTRLQKLDDGRYGALVLAAAGLGRLGLQDRIHRVFTTEEMLPAACQGILAIQARVDYDAQWLDAYTCAESWTAAQAERAFVEELGAGCASPVGAFACLRNGALVLEGMWVDATGAMHRGKTEGSPGAARDIGVLLARELKEKAHV